MKVRDLLRKVVNGENLPQKIKINNTIYELNNIKCLDELYVEKGKHWYYYNFSLTGFYDNEVEIIEEDNEKYISKYNTGLDNGRWTKESIKDGIQKDNMTLEDIVIEIGKEQTLIKEKLFELIDRVNNL